MMHKNISMYKKTEEDFIQSHSSSGRTLIAVENNIPEYKITQANERGSKV